MVDHKPRVVVIYKSLPQYRRQFFVLLRDRLAEQGVEFLLIYGYPGQLDASRKDLVDIAWAIRIQNRILRFGHKELYWQPCLEHLRGADLVIVEQASKLLINYVLLGYQALHLRKVAFWGHGRNFQPSASHLGEWMKRWVSRLPHWWFAYNELSAGIVRDLGYPSSRITLVQNAIDTTQLVVAASKITTGELGDLQNKLGITSDNVAVYCGAMYKERRIDFLLAACHEIKKRVPNFEIIFMGAGPEQSLVEEAAATYSWMHYVGPKFDDDKVSYFKLSKVYLLPGPVGLGILDSFALETPLVTTNLESHGPEIEYMLQDVNGVITPNDLQSYAQAVAALLLDERQLHRLVDGCKEAAKRYTVELMVQNFAQGVMQALGERRNG